MRFHRADATEAEDTLTDWTSARQVGPNQVSLASFDYRLVLTQHGSETSAIDQGTDGAQVECHFNRRSAMNGANQFVLGCYHHPSWLYR
ncbi:hypothetical protein FAZ21_04195 [Chitiniphilus eburneus]|uniref:Uncharacterized protein n=1 Tax=Chitiniphilus eburneus TaxID=2571148 RepID=A0A4V5MRU7_9NEIS|nr:hypothetical protein FAZ21_04195 [Chitiniphilus eburneus]